VGVGVGAFVLLLLIFAAILLLLRRRSGRQAPEAVPVPAGTATSPLPTPSTGEYERVTSLLPPTSQYQYHYQTPPAARHEYDAIDSPLE
jgi:hypothetical protein